MSRRNWIATLIALLAGAAVAQDYRRAPSDSTLGERATRFAKNKRVGAYALWSALAVASVWIGVARTRQRRRRRAAGA